MPDQKFAIRLEVSGGGGGFLSGIGSFLGGLFADGGIMTSRGPLPLNRYASGGIANSPQLAMFGEGRTPEAYVPLPDGRSIPVSMKDAPSAPSLSQSFNIDARGSNLSEAQLRAIVENAAREANRRLLDSIRRGGLARRIVGAA
jgi:hypothetical protein